MIHFEEMLGSSWKAVVIAREARTRHLESK
jgi:hypothetical protein